MTSNNYKCHVELSDGDDSVKISDCEAQADSDVDQKELGDDEFDTIAINSLLEIDVSEYLSSKNIFHFTQRMI